MVVDGHDPEASSEGCRTQQLIIINTAAFLPWHIKAGAPLDPALVHKLVIAVTHELAHMLAEASHHGQAWRDMHESLLQKIYASATSKAVGRSSQTACQFCLGCAVLKKK